MLQLYPVYLLWNRCKTLTGSLDPTRANGTNKPCIGFPTYSEIGSGGSKGVSRRSSFRSQNFLNFMQLFWKIGQNHMLAPCPVGWRPLVWGVLDPPLISDAKLKGTIVCQKNGLKMKEIGPGYPRISVADPGFPHRGDNPLDWS